MTKFINDDRLIITVEINKLFFLLKLYYKQDKTAIHVLCMVF